MGESGVEILQGSDRGLFATGDVVTNDLHLAAEMLQQVAEEGGDAGGVDRAVDERADVKVAAKGYR